MSNDEYLRRDAAAAHLQARFGAFTRQTLAKLACTGGGPKYRKFGRFPVYTRADLEEWANSRMSCLVDSTSALSAT